jgi:DNA-binding response OmpR family regulator
MRAPRLLIVEDEVKLAANLKRGLGEEEYFVDTVPSAETARESLSAANYDLMVLDLRLPGIDGITFLRDLRDRGSIIPVLILTARDATEDLVSGLNSGADDYLTKPFAFSELLARIRALLRRPLSANRTVIEAGELRLDTARRQAWRRQRELHLSPKELMVLECLMGHAGVAVTRDTIGEAVWGADYNPLSNIVEVFINRLRQKIDLVRQPSLIVTIRGTGYMLRVDLPRESDSGTGRSP